MCTIIVVSPINAYHPPQFSLSPDIKQWGFDLSPAVAEPDDALHTPDPEGTTFGRGFVPSGRGCLNIGCLLVLCVGLVTLL
jgi:beta-glucan synthesis-associated protein KRE6